MKKQITIATMTKSAFCPKKKVLVRGNLFFTSSKLNENPINMYGIESISKALCSKALEKFKCKIS